MFEKEKGTRSAVNITISGIGAPNDPPIVIDTAEDASYTMKNSEQE
jgi:hypothetical protein